MTRHAAWVALTIVLAAPLASQQWHRGDSVELIRRAAAQRNARDADSNVTSWQASAHGFLRFASVLDHGDGPVERVIRADELQVEVYGESPNRSKQIIRAWRDTTFLPNQMVYHRDHLGIVANDFGPMIRLGQGEEVRDVPHPLSTAGLAHYQFAIGDTVTIASNGGRTRVAAVQVRPVDPGTAATVGTLFLDIDRAQLVQFIFTFTPASYRDGSVETIAVSLENSLQVRGRWLPWKQSIVITRGSSFFDLPVRTVIRADWTIDDYQLGVHHGDDRFLGAYLDGPAAPFPGGTWGEPIAIQLGLLPATTADVDQLVAEATRELGGHRVDALPRFRLASGGISDIVALNRVEGVTLGLGARLGVGAGTVITARLADGLSDHRIVGHLAVAMPAGAVEVTVGAERLMQDVGDVPVISRLGNSLATLGGVDYGDYVLIERVAASVAWHGRKIRYSIQGGREWSWNVATAFDPPGRTTLPTNAPLGIGGESFGRVEVARTSSNGAGWRVTSEVTPDWTRTFGLTRLRRRFGAGELQLAASAGVATGSLPPYRAFVLGGLGTLPGVPFRSLSGSRMALVDFAWALPVGLPTPPLSPGRSVRLPTTVAPFISVGSAGGMLGLPGPWQPGAGRIEPVAGLRADLWGPLFRLELGTALRTGNVQLSFDVHPDWWPLM